MKIGLLGAASSIHLVRIANQLIKSGDDVVVISLPDHIDKENIIEAKVEYLKAPGGKGYYINAREVKEIVNREHIDVLNAHYASGYGTLGRLSGVHPLIVSVWGSDIFSFPKNSLIKRSILKKNLAAADLIFSTSRCMARETEKYVSPSKEIVITPFGVDIEKFNPDRTKDQDKDKFVYGFLKGLDSIYGVDIFLDAFDIVYKWACKNGINVHAQICGAPHNESVFTEKQKSLESASEIKYVGRIAHESMPDFIKECDAICITSREESFGVVAIEAMACGVPCVTSDAPGLAEVMIDGETGYVSENEPESIAEKMIAMIDKGRRTDFAIKSRKHVETNYDFEKNVDCLRDGYRRVETKIKNKGI